MTRGQCDLSLPRSYSGQEESNCCRCCVWSASWMDSVAFWMARAPTIFIYINKLVYSVQIWLLLNETVNSEDGIAINMETYRRKSELQDWIGTRCEVWQKGRYALVDTLLSWSLWLHLQYAIDAFLQDVGMELAKIARVQPGRWFHVHFRDDLNLYIYLLWMEVCDTQWLLKSLSLLALLFY